MDRQERNKTIIVLHEKLIKVIGESGKQAINHYFSKINKDDIYNCKSIYNLSNNKLAEKFFILYRLYYYTENKNRLDNLQYNLDYDVSLVISKGLYHKITTELNDQETARFKVILKAFKIFFLTEIENYKIDYGKLYEDVFSIIKTKLSIFKSNKLDSLVKKQCKIADNKDYKKFFIRRLITIYINYPDENYKLENILSFFGELDTINNDYAYPYILAISYQFRQEIKLLFNKLDMEFIKQDYTNPALLNHLLNDINKF